MHLAICDDHIADRKQMERLLDRESQRRASTTGIFYVDSYGSENSILSTPMIYDAIFMDMTEDGADAVKIANELRKAGTLIPIVFCCQKVNYRLSDRLPDNVLFLDKPIQTAALAAVIDELLILVSRREKRLEFRNMSDTFYLLEKELLYARPRDGIHMTIHLTDGQERIAEASFENFCAALCDSDSFIALANKTVINMLYIRDISLFKVMLTDGSIIRLALGEAGSLKKAVAGFQSQLPDPAST